MEAGNVGNDETFSQEWNHKGVSSWFFSYKVTFCWGEYHSTEVFPFLKAWFPHVSTGDFSLRYVLQMSKRVSNVKAMNCFGVSAYTHLHIHKIYIRDVYPLDQCLTVYYMPQASKALTSQTCMIFLDSKETMIFKHWEAQLRLNLCQYAC